MEDTIAHRAGNLSKGVECFRKFLKEDKAVLADLGLHALEHTRRPSEDSPQGTL